MKEYTIRKSFNRDEATLKTDESKGNLYSRQHFKEDAETLLDFLQCEIPIWTLKELRNLLEKQRFWKMIAEKIGEPTEETIEFEVVGLNLIKRKDESKKPIYRIRLLNGDKDVDISFVSDTPTTDRIFADISLNDVIEMKIKRAEE